MFFKLKLEWFYPGWILFLLELIDKHKARKGSAIFTCIFYEPCFCIEDWKVLNVWNCSRKLQKLTLSQSLKRREVLKRWFLPVRFVFSLLACTKMVENSWKQIKSTKILTRVRNWNRKERIENIFFVVFNEIHVRQRDHFRGNLKFF